MIALIPLAKNFSWRKPPLLTAGLILLNVTLFVLFQRNDNTRWEEAMHFYQVSGLLQLEEKLHRIYLQGPGKLSQSQETAVAPAQGKSAPPFSALRDAAFVEAVKQGRVVERTDPLHGRWMQLRSEFDLRLEQVTSFRYGFRPAYPRPLTLLSCMFLHGGWGHLVGNMVFLWLIGCLIEYGCRHVVFPLVYLAGGVAGSGFFWLLNLNSPVPLVGASGAIAGIMGAFTVFYGLKKVRIFLNMGFYFNYLSFSAIWLLPLWMTNELAQMFFTAVSPVAYAAHLGGLGCGAAMAFIARRLPGCLDTEAFAAAEEQNKYAPALERALAHMGALNFSAARRLLEDILQQDPENTAACRHLYTIERQEPENPRFHRATAGLLSLLSRKEHFQEVCAIFQEYLRTARPPRLTADLYLRVSQCFAATGNLAQASRILVALIKRAPRLPALPTALLKLAQLFENAGQKRESNRCLTLLQDHFPLSNESRIAAGRVRPPERTAADP